MKNNLAVLAQIKSEIGKDNQEKFISQEEMYALISADSGVKVDDLYKAFRSLRKLTADRLNNKEDVLIPGIMRITPGEGGNTKRHIKIKQISRYLREQLK